VPTRPVPSQQPDTHNTDTRSTAPRDTGTRAKGRKPPRQYSHPEDKLPLGQINLYAIDRLTLTVPSTIIDPRPPVRPLTVLEARITAMRSKDPQARDQAWRHVAQLARTERGDWNLFALCMAYPGLRAKITPHVKRKGLSFPQAAAVHYTMAIEFLFALHRLDLARPYLLSRLIGAAYDQASGRKQRPEPVTVNLEQMSEADWAAAAEQQHEEADLRPVRQVLNRLVRQTRDAPDGQRLTGRHAALIARTYLAGETLTAVAASLGISQSNASKRRTRAEHLIAVLLDRADLTIPDMTIPDMPARREKKPPP
jgi:hypothetical protein